MISLRRGVLIMISLHNNRTLTKTEVGTGGSVWTGLEKPQDS